jgi:radical SAM protein with 4Fe4S-binding SPASM domain
MLNKFPAIKESNTLLIQPFGGQIYISIDQAMRLGLSGHEHELNLEGAAILKRCTGVKTVREMIDEICVEFDDMPSSVEPKVVDFLKITEEKGYISIQDIPCPAKGFIKGSPHYVTPFRAIIEVTSSCNLRCVHCYGSFSAQNKDELSTEEIIRILSVLHELGTEGLNISGGEPLLRKDLLEILDYCYEKFSFSLLTNGTLIDDKFAKKFSEYTLSPLQISLYGFKAEDHDSITGVPGSFDRTVKGIESLVRHDVYVMIAYLYVPGDVEYIEKMAEFCADLGVSRYRVGSIVTVGRGENLAWEPNHAEFRRISTVLKKLSREYEERMRIQRWDPGGEKTDEQDPTDIEEPGHLKCQIGAYSIVVDSNGDLLPCGLLRWRLGNLIKENPRQLLARKDTQFFSTIYAPSDLLCGDCQFLYQCRKCHAKAATHFSQVVKCPWYDQFEDAPENIVKNLQTANI